MNSNATIGVGVVGLGFMGQTHIQGFAAAAAAGLPCRLRAVCDQDPARLRGADPKRGAPSTAAASALFDPKTVKVHSGLESLLADPDVHAVSICTHTDTHVDYTIQALAAGKHVLVEKPLAVKSADARRAVAAARESKALAMPGLCMRFWPGWAWLKEQIDNGTYGSVRSAVFERLASPPAWAPDFYRDSARSGGALVDLHIHDADFVRWCFGDPDAVSSTGSIDHLTTLYRYDRGRGPAHVVAEGGWDHAPGFKFRMRFVVVFDQATAEFESDREQPLTVVHKGEETVVRLESVTGWELEIRHFVEAIAGRNPRLRAKLDDAAAVAELLEAEAESLRTGQTVRTPHRP